MRRFFIVFFLLSVCKTHSQTSNDILNLLIANKNISRDQADSLRADAAIKQQETEASRKMFLVNAARQIKISGYTQLRYQALDEYGKKDGFDLRRARVDLSGNFTPYLSFRLMSDFADKPKLLDAYAEVKINDYFNVTLGQIRIPFSLENLITVRTLELIDFSQATEALVSRNKDVIGNQNGRDIGIQLWGALWKRDASNILEYRIAILNGSGINIADTANEAKDIVGRLIVSPFKGLSVGGSLYNGWGKAIKPGSDFKGRSQTRNRFGVDVNYSAGRLALRGEYMQGTDGKTLRSGWYAWGGYYVIPGKLQLLAKYDTFDPDRSNGNNMTTNYVTGANFNFNAWSRLQAFYTFREEQSSQVNNNYLSIQFQAGF